MEDTKINIILPFLKGMLTASLVILIGTLAIVSCEDISIGKTKEEIAREMFEVDSLIKTIHMQLDSTAIDFNKIYIDAQRINNGH
jgi:hypothetical protein|tara:strand:- start:1611 stop:1865 length:255 start_codon:yes stop_codon:yes gene_type:complete